MNFLLATQQYVNEMIRLAGPGMKVILMDKETVSFRLTTRPVSSSKRNHRAIFQTSIISCAHAQSEMMQKEAYLFERIDAGAHRDPIKFLKCVAFLRPTPENVQLLSEELRSPKYAQYYICKQR